MTLRVIAYGGGVQSTALVVLASQGKIDFPTALFSNVGDDSEHPATLDYVRNVATPWANNRGMAIFELHRTRRTGKRETLWQELHRDDRTINIPIRMPEGMPGNRNCTGTHKIKVVSRWLREHGATKDDKATVAIGISTDEYHRAGRRYEQPREVAVYPLLDLDLSRQDCANIIHRAGLPVPPKSSCFFCPFHKPSHWAEMRRDEPDLFQKSVDLETMLIAKRERMGRDPGYLTRFGKPLAEAVPVAQPTLFSGDDWLDESGECDDGYCFI